MKQLEKLLKAFANRRRLAIIKYLKVKREATVSQISEEIELSFRSTSRHLRILASRGVLDRTQRGLEMFYYLANSQETVGQFIISHL